MLFTALYEFAASGGAKSEKSPVSVTKLAHHIKGTGHDGIGQINFWPVKMNENVMLGYMTEDFDRSSAYDEEFKVVDIKYSNGLDFCWSRMVCCKELMHAFDTASEKTSSRERFIQLMEQLESPPMAEDFSKMLIAEFRAEWMALIVLCPKEMRDQLKARIDAGEIDDAQAADLAKLPAIMMRAIKSEYYDAAIEDLIR
jgi:hypothetical protein